ncbi:methyltransferase domain-containing protein [Virgibacillus ainsalahensis]
MPKMTKKMNSAIYVSKFESMFKCPVCGSSMHVGNLKSLQCANHHSFDFTKQGYLNLMTQSMKSKYSKELFEERRKVIAEVGLFEELSQSIAEIIHHRSAGEENISLIDTGCGEGSHLSNVCNTLKAQFNQTATGAGIDIAKEGVFVAAKNYAERIWAVADLANTPFKDQQFNVILNILSPSNYDEFHRLLKDEGFVMKVVPQSGYLKELREAFFEKSEKQTYSNEDIVNRFEENFDVVDHKRLTYTKQLDHSSIKSLVRMTPLTWNIPEEKLQSFLKDSPGEITVDLELLIGMKTS